jgi:tetratricopeptide (TPR) repeat protein
VRDFGGHGVLQKHEAELVLPRALAVLDKTPDDVDALHAVGHCYNVLEDDIKSLRFLARAAETPSVATYASFAAILRQCGFYEEAFHYIQAAHQWAPEDMYVGHTYAEELIRQGKWLEAWPLCSQYRFSKMGCSPPEMEEWKGQDIRGKRIAVILEGGRGDTFWLFRFIPRLTAMGAIVSLLGPRDLAEFLEGHPFLGEPDSEPEHYDYWVSVFELLQWLEVAEPYWPGEYFNAEPDERYRGKIGLCWNCGEAIDVRKYRSLKKEQADRLLQLPNVVTLQFGDNPDIHGWRDTARIIAALDLVISMDTAVCHLAGAMGKPTWLVLGGWQDCKWMDRETSGWYPSMRVFRADPGNFGFENVLAKVEEALHEIHD